MQAERHRRVKALFLEALELEGDAQAAFLQDQCDDAEMLAEVEGMLAADAAAGARFEDVDLLGVLGSRADVASALPSAIDGFEIVREVGRGGMGVVYEARQRAPQRRVALKLLQNAVASAEARLRFAREAELLGRLQHRGIAQVVTSGTWESPGGAQPYLVMEFIEGEPITTFAASHQLDDRARIELVAAVADAVEHAHQRSVVHRDLKPGNVLVTADGEPKVLDFGVARAVGGDADLEFARTRTGQVVGTPAYMSPEQAAGEMGLVDGRTDVHALGALLYELLTGSLPREVRDLSVTKALTTLGNTPARPLRMLRPDLRGDLDTVVGKALESEVSDRYATAQGFAADLRRYLDDLPIEARPPSAIYQLRKFARRNRLLVGGTVALLVLLVLGLGGTLYGLDRSIEQRDEARREALKAGTILAFLQDMLESVKPEESLGDDVRMAAILEEAATGLDASVGSEPEVEAALRYTIGTTFLSLSRLDEAKAQLERAVALRREHLGNRHLDTAMALYQSGRLGLEMRELAAARLALHECLSIRRELLGAPHADLALALDSLGAVERRSGDYEAAERALLESLAMREALTSGPDKGLSVTLSHLGQLRSAQSRFEEAEDLMRRNLALNEALYPAQHPDIANSRNNLASLLHDRGRYEEAGEFYREALAAFRAVYGNDHLAVAHCLNNYASLQEAREEFGLAEELFLESLAIRERLAGEDSVSAAVVHNNLGVLYVTMGDFDRAAASYRRAAEIRERKLEPGHPDIITTRNNLAAVRYYQKDPAGAVVEFRAALAQLEAAHDGMTRDMAIIRHNIVNCLWGSGQLQEALDEVQGVYEWRRTELGPRHVDTCLSGFQRGSLLRDLKRFDESEAQLLATWGDAEASDAVNSKTRTLILDAICKLYQVWERPEQLAEWRRKLEAESARGGGD